MKRDPNQLMARQYGGSRQVLIENATHLALLDKIDPALWAATSVPIKDLHVDESLLKILDAKGTGRLRSDDLITLRDWIFARLSQRDGLANHSDQVHADDFDANSEVGVAMQKSARHLLAEVGKTETESLSLSDVKSFRASYSKRLINGDGVVAPSQISDPEISDYASKIVATIGGTTELCGDMGVSKADIEKFRAEAQKYEAWFAQGKTDVAISPFGDDTSAAYDLVMDLKPKVEGFFDQCAMLELEGSGQADLKLSADDLKAIAKAGAEAIADHLKKSPIAPPNPEGRLVFSGPINPLHKASIEKLRSLVIAKHPGMSAQEKAMEAMDREDWKKIEGVFGAYAAWKSARPAGGFDALNADLLNPAKTADLDARLTACIDQDLMGTGELVALEEMEKLLLLQRWFLDVASSMVNFSSLYAPKERSILNAGSLIIDGRRLEFCQRVYNRAEHKSIATDSLFFLVYASVSEKEGAPVAMEVVAPLTAGERGQLRVGKRGLFIDHTGKPWDAVIVDLVENPISLSEAIRAPFKKAAKAISSKIEAFTSSKMTEQEDLATGKLNAGLTKVGEATKAKPADAPAPVAPDASKAADGAKSSPTSGIRDLVLGGGIAFAALGSAVAYIVSALSSVNPLNALIAVASIVLAIVLLLTLMSWTKLKKRDLSLLFEANGWAVNASQRLSRRLGGRFTIRPKLPKGTKLVFREPAIPDEEKPKRCNAVVCLIAVLVVVALGGLAYWHFGLNSSDSAPAVEEISSQVAQDSEKAPAAPSSEDEAKADAPADAPAEVQAD